MIGVCCCSEENDGPSIVGDWVGVYEQDTVNINFNSSTCSLNFSNRVINYSYSLKSDTLFFDNKIFGKASIDDNSLRIKKLPSQDVTRDINIIYLSKFFRKNASVLSLD